MMRYLLSFVFLIFLNTTPTNAQVSILGDEVTWGDAYSWVMHMGVGSTVTVAALPITDDPLIAAHVSTALSLGYQLGQWSVRGEWRTVDSTMDVITGAIGAYLTTYLIHRWAKQRDG